MVVLRGSPETLSANVQVVMATVFIWILHADEDMDFHRKLERLENVRENVRTITECLGYRAITHPCVILWQAFTAMKIWFDQTGIPNQCPTLVEYPYLLVTPDGMGNIISTRPLSSINDLPFVNKLVMDLVGNLTTIGMLSHFETDGDMKNLWCDVKDLFLDIVYL